jgi:hypothetical protein
MTSHSLSKKSEGGWEQNNQTKISIYTPIVILVKPFPVSYFTTDFCICQTVFLLCTAVPNAGVSPHVLRKALWESLRHHDGKSINKWPCQLVFSGKSGAIQRAERFANRAFYVKIDTFMLMAMAVQT